MGMELKLGLSLRQGLRLVMTPALQQAIKLLQMSTLDLRQEIATELQENPALEEVQDTRMEAPAEATLSQETPAPEGDDQTPDSFSEVDLDSLLRNYYDGASSTPRDTREIPENQTSWETTLSRPENLTAVLERQLSLNTSDAGLLTAGRAIIGNMDGRGYLQASLEELVTMSDCSPECVGKALKLVQDMEPAGVGARDLRECLLLQLRQRGMESSVAARIVADHLDLLQSRHYEDLARQLDIDMDGLKKQMEILRSLNPSPGDQFNPSTAITVKPDVYVVKTADGYQVRLDDSGFPRLRVSRYCRKIIQRGSGASREDRDFVRQKLNSAVRLIKSIEERQRTIYRVACSIVEQQKRFLDEGIGAIRPMVLKDVAEDIGVHESTVSRVVNHKYMHTSHGVLEMRFFFHSGLTNTSGEDISSLTIKEKIRRLVDEEDSRHPFSDAAIARHLKETEEIPIARRTVAKYREEMRIPASTSRRRSLFSN